MSRLQTWQHVLTLAAGLLIVKVTAAVVLNYQNYLPARLRVRLLAGAGRLLLGPLPLAFYSHIASGPSHSSWGLVLIGDRFRRRFPAWHRYLGRMLVACVLLLVTPSGLWMAYHAAAGPVGAAGLAALAVATALCIGLGWRAAVGRRFADHRRWMWRTFLLLCSAVVLRVIGGLATVMGAGAAWIDPLAIWMSWLLPLAAFEWVEGEDGRARRAFSDEDSIALCRRPPRSRSSRDGERPGIGFEEPDAAIDKRRIHAPGVTKLRLRADPHHQTLRPRRSGTSSGRPDPQAASITIRVDSRSSVISDNRRDLSGRKQPPGAMTARYVVLLAGDFMLGQWYVETSVA